MTNYTVPDFYHVVGNIGLSQGVDGFTIRDAEVISRSHSAAVFAKASDGANSGMTQIIMVPRRDYSPAQNEAYTDYLEVQWNEIDVESSASHPSVKSIVTGSSQNVLAQGRFSYSPENNPTTVKFFPAVEVFDGSVPILIWMQIKDDNGSLSSYFDYYPVPTISDGSDGLLLNFPTDGTHLVHDATNINFPSGNGPGTGTGDLCTLQYNDSIYVFWYDQQTPTVIVNQIQVELNANPITLTAGTNNYIFGLISTEKFNSIDIAVAHIPSAQDSSVLNTYFALASLYVDDTNVTILDIKLVRTDLASTTPVYSAAAPSFLTPGSTVRVAWGTLPASDGSTQQTSGLVITIQSGGSVKLGVLGLANDGQTGTLDGWTDITPPLGNYSNEGNTPDSLSVPAITASLYSLLVPSTAGDGDASYSVALTAAVLTTRDSDYRTAFVEYFTAPLPSFTMDYTAGSNSTIFNNSDDNVADWTDADYACAVSTWQVIGVIAGLPPHDPTWPDLTASVTVTLGKTDTDSSSTELDQEISVSMKVSGVLGDCGTSVTSGISKGQSNSSTVSLEVDLTKSADTDNADDYSPGWVVVFQPGYRLDTFDVKTRQTTPAETGYQFQQVIVDPTNNALKFIEFDIQNPMNAIDDSLFNAKLRQFDVINWPSTTDLAGWEDGSSAFNPAFDTSTWSLTEFASMDFLGMGTGPTTTQKISTSSTTTSDLKSTMKFEASAGTKFMSGALDFSVDGTLTAQNSVSYSATDSFSISISWQTSKDIPDLTLFPKLYLASATDAIWVPTLNGDQTPWLLTWKVTGV